MRKIFALLLLLTSASCFSQQITAPAPMTSSDYLAKAKKQNITAWILLGGGFGLSTAGIIAGTQEANNTINELFNTGETKKSSTGAILLIAGGATMLSSIPFFVAATENKKKAAKTPVPFKFKMETEHFIRQGSIVKTSYPAIALRIGL